MIKFKQWLVKESQFQRMSKNQKEDNNFSNDLYKVLLNFQKVQNEKINIYEKIGVLQTNRGEIDIKIGKSTYFFSPDIIYVSIDAVKKLRNELTSLMEIGEIGTSFLHEVGHAIDRKIDSITWSGPSQRYKNIVQDLKRNNYDWSKINPKDKIFYQKEPIEFDAIGTQFYYTMKHIFQHGNKTQVIKMLKNCLNGNIQQLTSFGMPIDDWQTSPYLMKKLKQKIANLILEFEKEVEKTNG